jgi:hypothetical protein
MRTIFSDSPTAFPTARFALVTAIGMLLVLPGCASSTPGDGDNDEFVGRGGSLGNVDLGNEAGTPAGEAGASGVNLPGAIDDAADPEAPRPARAVDGTEPLSADEVAVAVDLVSQLEALEKTATPQPDRQAELERELVAMGPPVISLLRKLQNRDNALMLAAVIVQIDAGGYDGASTSAAADGEPAGAEPPGPTPADPVPPEPQPQPEPAAEPQAASFTDEQALDRLLGALAADQTPAERRAVTRFLIGKIREMEAAAAALDFDRAEEIGRAVLALAGEAGFAAELRRRLQQISEMQMQLGLLRGRVTALTPQVPYGTRLTFRITLKNVSRRVLSVAFTHVEQRTRMRNTYFHAPVQLRVTFTQFPDPRSPIATTRTEQLEAEGVVELAPGDVWSMDWHVETGEAGSQLRGIGDYEVGGTVRPLAVTDVQTEEAQPVQMIALEPAEARVVPKGFEAAQADPLGEVRRAYGAGDPVALLVGAAAAKSADAVTQHDVIALLIDQLAHAPRQMRDATFHALQEVTGLQFGADERHWRLWFEARRPPAGRE